MQGNINNMIRIPTSIDGKFFRYWLEFLRPIHNLTEREIQVTACILKQRHNLSKVIKNDEILDKVVLGEDTKRKIREECNISLPHFQVIMGKLRKVRFIEDGKINPRFIPSITEDKGIFHLLLHFELN